MVDETVVLTLPHFNALDVVELELHAHVSSGPSLEAFLTLPPIPPNGTTVYMEWVAEIPVYAGAQEIGSIHTALKWVSPPDADPIETMTPLTAPIKVVKEPYVLPWPQAMHAITSVSTSRGESTDSSECVSFEQLLMEYFARRLTTDQILTADDYIDDWKFTLDVPNVGQFITRVFATIKQWIYPYCIDPRVARIDISEIGLAGSSRRRKLYMEMTCFCPNTDGSILSSAITQKVELPSESSEWSIATFDQLVEIVIGSEPRRNVISFVLYEESGGIQRKGGRASFLSHGHSALMRHQGAYNLQIPSSGNNRVLGEYVFPLAEIKSETCTHVLTLRNSVCDEELIPCQITIQIHPEALRGIQRKKKFIHSEAEMAHTAGRALETMETVALVQQLATHACVESVGGGQPFTHLFRYMSMIPAVEDYMPVEFRWSGIELPWLTLDEVEKHKRASARDKCVWMYVLTQEGFDRNIATILLAIDQQSQWCVLHIDLVNDVMVAWRPHTKSQTTLDAEGCDISSILTETEVFLNKKRMDNHAFVASVIPTLSQVHNAPADPPLSAPRTLPRIHPSLSEHLANLSSSESTIRQELLLRMHEFHPDAQMIQTPDSTCPSDHFMTSILTAIGDLKLAGGVTLEDRVAIDQKLASQYPSWQYYFWEGSFVDIAKINASQVTCRHLSKLNFEVARFTIGVKLYTYPFSVVLSVIVMYSAPSSR
jgi:hypothetical protein